jgi:transposase
VIDMELLSVIRRWHYRDHFSIREISRRTGLSREHGPQYLRSDSEEPKFSIPDRPSKLDPHADKLSCSRAFFLRAYPQQTH